MALWYYLQKGRPVGPVTVDELKNEIAAGRLGSHDLLYRERDTAWNPARQFVELKPFLPAEEASHDWVLLMRKPDGSGYRQRGPYAVDQILAMIKTGEVHWTDHVWRKGLKEWYKILALPEFQAPHAEAKPTPAAPREKMRPPLPKEAGDDISKELSADLSEITQRLAMPQEDEEPPAEAVPITKNAKTISRRERKAREREERTGISWEEIAEKSQKIKIHLRRGARKLQKKPLELVRRTGVLNYYLELSAVKKGLFLFGLLVTLSSGLFLLTFTSSYLDRRKTQLESPDAAYVAPTAESRVAQKAPGEVQVPPPPVPEKAPPLNPAQVPRVTPTYLRYEVVGNGSAEAKLRVLTDGSLHYPITVVFASGAGHVLEQKSVARVTRLGLPEERDVELKRLRLPAGYYDVSLTVGSLKTEGRVNFDVDGPDAKKKFREQRKRLIYDYNEERYSFLKTISRVEKEAYRFAQTVDNAANLKSWSTFYRDWRKNFSRIQNAKMEKITSRNRGQYVLAEPWLELKQLHSQVDDEAKRLNGLKSRKNPGDGTKMKAMAVRLSKLKEELLQESMWRRD